MEVKNLLFPMELCIVSIGRIKDTNNKSDFGGMHCIKQISKGGTWFRDFRYLKGFSIAKFVHFNGIIMTG